MSSKFWASSSDDLSVDSSVHGAFEEARDPYLDDDVPNISEKEGDSAMESESFDRGALVQARSTDLRLPIRQPQEHAALFYLSLIEGRCRTQAARTLNAGRLNDSPLEEDDVEVCSLARRLFVDMTKELAKAGMIPEEMVGQNPTELRQYLTSFDAILNNIAIQPIYNNPITTTTRAIADSRSSDLSSDGYLSTVSFDSNSQALIPFSIKMPKGDNIAGGAHQNLLQTIFNSGNKEDKHAVSLYESNYEKIQVLGQGGFGSVYLAKYKIDNQAYAIKKIVIPAWKVDKLQSTNRLQSVLIELRTLAQFDHPCIVRYFYSWLETCPPGLGHGPDSRAASQFGDTQSDDEDHDEEDSDENEYELSVLGHRSLTLSVAKELNREDKSRRRTRRSTITQAVQENFSGIEFGEDSDDVSKGLGKLKLNSKQPTDSQGEPSKPSRSFFQKPGEANSDSSDADESEDSQRLSADNRLAKRNAFKADVILYMAMSPYPLSLEDYIGVDRARKCDEYKLKYCFHKVPALRILKAILEGVEYLHHKEVVHRDLKPANIFLSIQKLTEPRRHEYFPITKCSDCQSENKEEVYVCPKIGDFGLVHEVKTQAMDDHEKDSPERSGSNNPFPFHPSQQVGTPFYCPKEMPKTEPWICTKLDVYSLGIIAFELFYPFGSSAERVVALGKLKSTGTFPGDWEHDNGIRDGIRAMIREDRDTRWSTSDVGQWIEKELAKCG